MDVEFRIDISNKHLKDANVQAKVAGVDITSVEQERDNDFTVHTDATTIISVGNIRRTITATLTADFEFRFPTNNDKRYALEGSFQHLFALQVPAASVNENLTLIP